MQISDQSGYAIFDSEAIAGASICSLQFSISNFSWKFQNAEAVPA
jgi:hypothetical protein